MDNLKTDNNLHSVIISSKRSIFSFDSFSCFSSSVLGLDGPDDILKPELGGELIGCVSGKSFEYFLTSAYSTETVELFEFVESSIKSIERLRRSGGSTLGDLLRTDVACFTGLIFENEDLEE